MAEVQKICKEHKLDAAASPNKKLQLYLDGFDEFGEKESIVDLLGISQNAFLQENIKLIITCRSTEISEPEIVNFLQVPARRASMIRAYICPVNSVQQNDYLEKFVKEVQVNKNLFFGKFNCFDTVNEYTEMFTNYPSLQNMAQEPFTLRLILGIMPDIKKMQKSTTSNITLYEIFQIFVRKWVENEIFRLNEADQYQMTEFVDIDRIESEEDQQAVIEQVVIGGGLILKQLWIADKLNNEFSAEDLEAIQNDDFQLEILKVCVKCLPLQLN